MKQNESDAQERTARPHTLESRTVRALTDYMTTVEIAPDLYSVTTQSGHEYTVDDREQTCECRDYQNREVTCKHLRRVAFATGKVVIPAWIDRSAIDDQLGMHVSPGPRVAPTATATDGGNDDERPADCCCQGELPCFMCWNEGFRTPAGDDR